MKAEGGIRTLPIESLSEYIHFVETDCREPYVLFRGQRKDTDLLPKIARAGLAEGDLLKHERKMFEDFKRFSLPYIMGPHPESDWEWLTLAEHHGLPTRLLDWTKNPLAALWFTVEKHEEEPGGEPPEGIVWVLKSREEDFVNISEEKNPFAVARTMVYEPSHITRRITAQAAAFTVHRYIEGSSFIPLNRNKDFKSRIVKLVVPAGRFEELRGQLDRCGINAATLFADLDDLCKYISWKNTQPEKRIPPV